MTTRTVTYQICDGCHKSTLRDDIEIAKSRPKYEGGVLTIDICNECSDADRFICRFCREVHDAQHPCEEMEVTNRKWRKQTEQ